MVTQGAREEHWREERWAGLAGSQPRASASLCSALLPKRQHQHPATAAPLQKQHCSTGWNHPPATGSDIPAPISMWHVPQSGGD